MNIDQAELLIRVDQNVINLVDVMNKHIIDDKEFQKFISGEVQPLKTSYNERQGAAKFASFAYGVIGGLVTLLGTFFFPHGVR